MGLFADFEAEAQFAHDFPFGVPNEYWHSKEGDVLVTNMTEQHIRNCMKLVGEDDDWYPYFQRELERRSIVTYWILHKPRVRGRNATYKCSRCGKLCSSYYNDVSEWKCCPHCMRPIERTPKEGEK